MLSKQKCSMNEFFADIEQKFNNKEDYKTLCQSE